MGDIWFRPRYGSFGFIAFGYWLHIKAPWCQPLYSERYGGNKWPKFMGWRVKFRKMIAARPRNRRSRHEKSRPGEGAACLRWQYLT